MWRHRITSVGQVSIPAEVRERWNVRTVAIEDGGDRLVLRPVPDDPVEALRGVFRSHATGLSGTEAIRDTRDAENALVDARWTPHRTR